MFVIFDHCFLFLLFFNKATGKGKNFKFKPLLESLEIHKISFPFKVMFLFMLVVMYLGFSEHIFT